MICYDKQIPHETPSLDQVRDRVTADYKRSQAMMQAQMAGRVFYQSLTNGLAQGKTFAAICTEAHVQPRQLPPFSISTRSLPDVEEMVNLNQLKQLAFSTGPGKASPFQPTLEGRLIVYVKDKLPLDNSKTQTDMPSFVSALRRTRQQEAFEDWFRKQAETALRDTPVAQQKNPPSMGASGTKS